MVVGEPASTTEPIDSWAAVVVVCADCTSITRPVCGSTQNVLRAVSCTEMGITAGSVSARTPNGSRPPLRRASSASEIVPRIGVTDVVAW